MPLVAAIDLGTLKPLQPLVFAIPVTNKSSLPLKIVGVKSACSCIAMRFDNQVSVQPGETYTLIAAVNTEKETDTQDVQLAVYVSNGTVVPVRVRYAVGSPNPKGVK